MIWAIGDIHGMFDPLKRLLNKLMELHYRGVSGFEIEKLVFIGDYIDYGPSSKEVLDLLIDLPFETVFLMGNHEDLLLQFIKRSDLFERYGNVWFKGSGGQQTVMSFFPGLAISDDDDETDDGAREITPEDFPLSERYLSFFDGLKHNHIETIGGREVLFVHSLFSPELPLEEQLAISSYDEFHDWRRKHELWIEDTFLWNKKEPTQRLGDYTVVHGHLPTPYIAKDWQELHGYDPRTKVPFLKFETPEDAEAKIDFKLTHRGFTFTAGVDPISINVDTGAVFGHRLSALGFGDSWSTEGQLQLVQIATDRGFRRHHEFTQSAIYFGA